MNILFISKLDGRSWAGPTYSVPNQVHAQSEYDNVLWYNLYTRNHPEWVSSEWENLPYYCDLIDYPNAKISELPPPFNKPDLIVVEQFYCYAKTSIPRQLKKGNIPYIIIPRGELTKAAQKRKSLKKTIFNFLYYKKFAFNAASIQYLTKQEMEDSGDKWNDRALIVPNGVKLPEVTKEEFSTDSVNAVVIGRIEPYQKGLDLLIDACEGCKKRMIDAGMTIRIYGPDRVGRLAEMKKMLYEKKLEDIISFHDAVYDDDKIQVLLKTDVFIIPSRFEGHPTALIEALSYGIPALVTTGANMREEIEEYNAGWGADVTVESIQKAILKIIDESGEFQKRGKNARNLAKKYAWNGLAKVSHDKYMMTGL